MLYHISRDGQSYGPYTLDDIRRYVASGNILLTDLTRTDETSGWIPVSQLLNQPAPAAPPPITSASAPVWSGVAAPTNVGTYASAFQPATTYSDPPGLHWLLVLLLGICTCSLFFEIWEIVQSIWMRRVHPRSNAIFFYIAHLVVSFLSSAGSRSLYRSYGAGGDYGSNYTYHFNPGMGLGLSAGLISFILLEFAWFDMRRSMLEHYNTCEPFGLRLSPVMTFFFGPIYFQYHLSRIRDLKRATRFHAASI